MKIISVILFLSLAALCYGQIDRVYDPALNDKPLDSLTVEDTLINKTGFFSLFTGKPGKAAFYSLILPGGGQAYNRKWLKVPLAIAVDGLTLYNVINSRRLYNRAQQIYLDALQEQNPTRINRARAQRDVFRKQNEYSYIWFGLGHLLTVVDAFVDRHLMEFDVSDDLSLSPFSTRESGVIPVIHFISVSYKFNSPGHKKTQTVLP